MYRCLEMRWPPRLRRSCMPAPRAGSKNMIASAASAPPLVAPNDNTSMPACHVAAAGETFMRAAFVGRDVGFRVTQDRAPRRRTMRDRQRVGGCARRHQKDRNIAFEDFRKPPLDAPGPFIVAIGKGGAFVGARNSRH